MKRNQKNRGESIFESSVISSRLSKVDSDTFAPTTRELERDQVSVRVPIKDKVTCMSYEKCTLLTGVRRAPDISVPKTPLIVPKT